MSDVSRSLSFLTVAGFDRPGNLRNVNDLIMTQTTPQDNSTASISPNEQGGSKVGLPGVGTSAQP